MSMEAPEDAKEKRREALWGKIPLPAWDRERFYRLFVPVNAKIATKLEEDEFSRLLMVLIGQHAERMAWRRTFAQHRIEAEDAAMEVLAKAIKKCRRMNLRKPCPLVLIDTMNHMITNDLISEQRRAVRKTKVSLDQGPEDFDDVDTRYSDPSLDGLRSAMKAAEPEICPTWKVKVAYRKMCKSILSGNHIPALVRMPRSIRDKITADEFALAAYKLNKLVERYAADIGSAAA